jgi:WD40 repeat protein
MWTRSNGLALGFTLLTSLLLPDGAKAQDRAKVDIVPPIPHSNWVTSVTFSSDGTRALSGSADQTLKLWDAATGKLIRTFQGHTNVVTSVGFSADGVRLLSGSWDKTLKLWDAATGELIRTFEGHSDAVYSVAFSRDGTRVLSGSGDRTLKLWDAATGKLIRTFKGHSKRVTSVAFSADGARLFSGSADQTLKLWDAATGQRIRTFKGHSDAVSSVAFSSNGARVLSGSGDKTLKLWDAATGRLTRTFQAHSDKVASVAFSPDGRNVLSGSLDKTLKLWNAATGELIRTFEEHSDAVYSVAFSPDGARLLSAAGRTLKLWEAATGEFVPAFQEPSGEVLSVAFSPDGRNVLSGSLDKTLATGELIRTFEGHSQPVTSVAFSADGARLLSGSRDQTLKVWDAATGQLIRTFEGHSDAVSSVAFSGDGAWALSGSWDQTLKLWDAATGKLIRTFKGHSAAVNSVAFSSDGSHLLSGSQDQTLRLWDAATGTLIRTFEGHSYGVNSLAFLPDGVLISGSWDATAKLWDAATGRLIYTFKGHSHCVSSLVVSRDGKRVVSGSFDGTLKMWEAATGELIRTFDEYSGALTSIAYSRDGRRVFSGSLDGTIRIWDPETGELLATLLARVGEGLAITAAGFFAGSPKGAEALSVVRGFEVMSIAHFYDHLYRPDLVEQLLKGDPESKHADAASELNLQKILDSGPAPQIEELPGRQTERTGDAIKLALRLVDTGGGIGDKVVWRVNGVTQGEVFAPAASAPTIRGGYRIITQTLKIDSSRENDIEFTAYNGVGLLASERYRKKIDRFGESTEPRPRMHVLAVGIGDYAKKDWRLNYPVTDAKALGDLLKAAAKGLYGDIKVTLVLDSEAIARGIEAAIDRMKGDVRASDVFVLFLAGHGRNIAGTYYFVPQDLTLEGGRTVMNHGIGQDKLQSWLARIPAQKSVLILDTCESAPATRGLDIERETAIDRLQHATGRSVITAASSAAFEGYQGHGLLTYTILDAFRKTDGSGDDLVELLQLAAHVDRQVPIISQKTFGVVQRPHNRIEGNFPLGVRTAVEPTATAAAIPKTHTHVLIREELVRERPAPDAAVIRALSRSTAVRVVEEVGEWAVIAREGQRLGYVAREAVDQLR